MKSYLKKVIIKSFSAKPLAIVESNSGSSLYIQDLVSNNGIHLSRENIELLYKMINPALRKIDQDVHRGVYSDNKSIELACGIWVEPKWGTNDKRRTEDDEVFVGEDDDGDVLYTFQAQKTTCKKCKSKKLKKK